MQRILIRYIIIMVFFFNLTGLNYVYAQQEEMNMKDKEITTEDKVTAEAYFAGGCFWGTEHHFQSLDGVQKTNVGFMGGHVENPTYKQVSSGKTKYIESIKVEFNPKLTPHMSNQEKDRDNYGRILEKILEL